MWRNFTWFSRSIQKNNPLDGFISNGKFINQSTHIIYFSNFSITCGLISIYKELSVQVGDSKSQAFNNAQRTSNCHWVNVFLQLSKYQSLFSPLPLQNYVFSWLHLCYSSEVKFQSIFSFNCLFAIDFSKLIDLSIFLCSS